MFFDPPIEVKKAKVGTWPVSWLTLQRVRATFPGNHSPSGCISACPTLSVYSYWVVAVSHRASRHQVVPPFILR